MDIVVVRGAGDLATGTILRLHKAGLMVVALDVERPTVIRRTVAFAQALFSGSCEVEGVRAVKVDNVPAAMSALVSGFVPVLADPKGATIEAFHPVVLIDAILAKRNLGTKITMAPFVVALGPGFRAGVDCHCVVETQRGHYLGSVIRQGTAAPNTGVPGIIAGHGADRVLRAPCEGVFRTICEIGDIVRAGDAVATVGDEELPVTATIDGVLRGLLHDGLEVTSGFKVGDIDPRGNQEFIHTVSDKARAVAGGVLEAVDGYLRSSAFAKGAMDKR